MCSCITCNCQDNCLIRILIAGGLIVGGVATAIGYYSVIEDIGSENLWAYFIGYTILICGLCIAWGLDMGVADEIKKRQTTN